MKTDRRFLKDVIEMKRERGDDGISEFKDVCKSFGSGQYATVAGATRAMRQWTRGKSTLDAFWRSRFHFLADLEAISHGTFFQQQSEAA